MQTLQIDGLGCEAFSLALFDGLRPDPDHTVTSWAEENVILSSASAAEPGPYRVSRTPYAREIQDCLSPHYPTNRVVFIKGTQIGGTQIGLNAIGFYIAHSPCPIMFIQKTVDSVKRVSKQRIAPMIAESPALRARVSDARARDSGNTMLQKDFPGGTLIMTGANSAVGLRSMPARFLFPDEVDSYEAEAEDEGDPIKLAERRTQTFGHRRKIFLVSTPTTKGRSRIESEYLASDQRMYHVACPHCGERQTLKFANLKWTWGDPASVHYVCEYNGCIVYEASKEDMLAAGKWIAAYPERNVAGFHLNSLYSPPGWMGWEEIAAEWEEATADRKLGKIEKHKTFINTILAETFEQKGDTPDANRLYERREQWDANTVPMRGLFLTAGADVQRDRLEVDIWAWGARKESWLVDHRVFVGDTSRPDVWLRLAELVQEQWPHEGGALMPLSRIAVDSGYATTEVYDFIRRIGDQRVLAIKGQERGNGIIGQPTLVEITSGGKKVKGGIGVWPVYTSTAKFETYGFLRLDAPEDGKDHDPGYVHLNRQTTLDWCKQLCAEAATTKTVGGQTRTIWEKVQDRNEALDCRVYARAAADVIGLGRFNEQHFEQMRQSLGIREGAVHAVPAAQTPAQPVNRGRRVRSQGI